MGSAWRLILGILLDHWGLLSQQGESARLLDSWCYWTFWVRRSFLNRPVLFWYDDLFNILWVSLIRDWSRKFAYSFLTPLIHFETKTALFWVWTEFRRVSRQCVWLIWLTLMAHGVHNSVVILCYWLTKSRWPCNSSYCIIVDLYLGIILLFSAVLVLGLRLHNRKLAFCIEFNFW